jgi:phospholipid/cholesterol/gamma-HCH transport system substrate-binding protein
MTQNTIETIVGFITIITALIFLTFAYNKGDDSSDIKNTYPIKASFQNAEGIFEGSDVRVAGIKIGFVEKLTLDKNNFFAIINFRINNDIKLPKDTQAAISTSGFLGSKFISLTPGASEEELSANDQIKHTQSSLNIESLVSKLMYSIGNK